jgi:hypothetical protein
MKKLIFMSIAFAMALSINAQENQGVTPKDSVDAAERAKGDTTRIRIGNRGVEIIENDGKTSVDIKKIEDENIQDEKQEENNNKYGDYDVSKKIEDKVEEKIADKFNDHKNKDFEPHWGGFGLGMNNFVNSSGSMSLTGADKFMDIVPEKSYNVQLNLWEMGLPLSNSVGFVTGLGFQWNNFRFDGDNSITKNDNGVIVELPAPEGVDYEKSILRATYLTAPLLLEFQRPVFGKKAYISFGVEGGLKLGSRTKIITNKSDKKQINKDDFNINTFTYSASARIGYRFLNLYANYSLVPLFEKDKGPELYPFTIGLTLVNF